jgi:hypothetical protein
MGHAMLVRRLLHGCKLKVVRENDAGDPALTLGDAICAVDQMPHPGGKGRLHIGAGYILEEGLEIKILLVMRPDGRAGLLPHERQHRLMVELGIVEAVQEVDRTRTGRRDADADLTRELRFATGHEACHFLMPNLDEVDDSIQPRKSADQSANAVPG